MKDERQKPPPEVRGPFPPWPDVSQPDTRGDALRLPFARILRRSVRRLKPRQ